MAATTTNGNMTKSHASRGLEGIVVGSTAMSDVDGQAGKLTIRGYSVEEIAGKATLEEVAYLLWHGELPKAAELQRFNEHVADDRRLPGETRAAIEAAARRMAPMDALRFAAASLTAGDEMADDISPETSIVHARRLVARIPVIIATYQRLRQGKAAVEPRADLGIAANYLYQMTGEVPKPAIVRGLDTYLVTVVDHSMNASTFTARVIASTAADMVSAVTGALGALKGPLHGGAPGPALSMIEEIGTPDRAEAWMKDALSHGKRLMGFGHRVYKVRDPRAEVLYRAAEALADETGERKSLELAHEVERIGVQVLAEAKPGRNLNTNVEFYTALLLRELGIPQDLFTPTFAIGRTAGWTAHIMEQQETGRLIRPLSEYSGAHDRKFVPLDQR